MNKKKMLCVLVVFSAIVVIFESFLISIKLAFIVIATFAILVGLLLLNRVTLRKLYLQKDPFKIGGKIRNVDYLVVGDMINPALIVPMNKTFVQIKSPNRSLFASFEILRHTSSILDEDNGHVIIAVKKNTANGSLSVFDIPFLYNLSIKKMGLGKLNRISKFPIFAKPLSSIKLILNCYEKKWKESICPNKNVIVFCKERNFNLKYYEN